MTYLSKQKSLKIILFFKIHSGKPPGFAAGGENSKALSRKLLVQLKSLENALKSTECDKCHQGPRAGNFGFSGSSCSCEIVEQNKIPMAKVEPTQRIDSDVVAAMENQSTAPPAPLLLRSCKFRCDGCPVHLIEPKLSEHEKYCSFQKVDCESAGCNQKVSLSNLVNHWLSQHSKSICSSRVGRQGEASMSSLVPCYFTKLGCTKMLPLEEQLNHQVKFHSSIFMINFSLKLNHFTCKKIYIL